MDFNRGKRILFNNLYKDLINLFIQENVTLAGGAITSIFGNLPLNDYDIYFKNKESRENVLKFFDDQNNGIESVFVSENAKTYNAGKCKIQLILRDDTLYREPIDLLKSFDFTVCMGAFSFGPSSFIFEDRFLIDLSSRRLIYNEESNCVLHSLWRIQKYVSKGFSIESPELIKIALTFAERYKSMKNLGDIKKELSCFNPSAYKKLNKFIEQNEGDNILSLMTLLRDYAIMDPLQETTNGY